LDGASNWQNKNRTIGGAVKALFKAAAKALACPPDDEPKPEPRRKDGESEKGFGRAAKAILRRIVGMPAERVRRFDAREAFQEAAAESAFRCVRTIFLSPEEWGADDAHHNNALDLLNQLNNEIESGSDYDGGFDTNKNHISLGL
jgi:hypothetical protein